MIKKEAIATFERAGYTYLGFKDAGWGEKFYTFLAPCDSITGGNSVLTYTLKLLRNKAQFLEYKMWQEAYEAELKAGIQEELFSDVEIESHYIIVN